MQALPKRKGGEESKDVQLEGIIEGEERQTINERDDGEAKSPFPSLNKSFNIN